MIYPESTSMDAQGGLSLGGVSVTELVRTHGSPLYIMDEATVRRNCRAYTETLAKTYPNATVVFAGKACLNLGLLNLMAQEKLGVDVVSAGELFTALRSQINPETIVFHGNNKSLEELEMAIQHRIRIVIDNVQELDNIKALTETLSQSARVMIRLKPEIEAHTHDYIKTGQIDSKFGIDKDQMLAVVEAILAHSQLEFLGIHSHIGSQIFDVIPFQDLAQLMAAHMAEIKAKFGIDIPELNLGGGVGIRYTTEDDPPLIETFVETLTQTLKAALDQRGLPHPRLLLEPGRSLVANAGVTAYSVGAIKDIPGVKTYLFIDGGMADNPRPMLYQSKYTFALANKFKSPSEKHYAVAGKYCESGDVLTHDVVLPEASKGDTLVVFGTGAYNYTMASNYNRAARPAMVCVGQGQSKVWVRRETLDDLLRLDNP
ncbi:MAG: diaminopimelate decarboxylase [Candidatus Margulisiibacteriota bacterium]